MYSTEQHVRQSTSLIKEEVNTLPEWINAVRSINKSKFKIAK